MFSMEASLAPPAATRPVFFERALLPHRSLPPRGFHMLMAVLFVISLGGSVLFLTIGAWPVCGFFGLDVAAIYVAFRVSYRSARRRETLRLAGDEFTVERVSIRGDRRIWRFQPFWLRVVLDQPNEHTTRLSIVSHGKSLVIGDFLPPPARPELAQSLKDALARWRASFSPANPD